MFACAVVVSVLIVVAWFPVSELVHERQQLAGATSQLGKIRHNVRSLNAEAKRLQTPTQVARIAQTQDGLAPAGDQLYQVLPSSGQTTTPTTTPPAGSPATTTTTFPAAPQHTATPGATSSPGFFGRVVQTLEFWQ
jgi:cell division protein FtsB